MLDIRSWDCAETMHLTVRHEASHVVVGSLLLDILPQTVSCRPYGETCGHCDWANRIHGFGTDQIPGGKRGYARNVIAMYMAGRAGVGLLACGYPESKWADDRNAAIKWAIRLVWSDTHPGSERIVWESLAELQQADVRADEILAEETARATAILGTPTAARAVEILAEAVLEKVELDEGDILDLLRGSRLG